MMMVEEPRGNTACTSATAASVAPPSPAPLIDTVTPASTTCTAAIVWCARGVSVVRRQPRCRARTRAQLTSAGPPPASAAGMVSLAAAVTDSVGMAVSPARA